MTKNLNISTFHSAPDPTAVDAKIPIEDLPQCTKCHSLLRPHVIWFGENLDYEVIKRTQEELALCDLCLLVGTSSVVYPAAGYAPQLAARGVPVAEFNLEKTPVTGALKLALHIIPYSIYILVVLINSCIKKKYLL